MKSNKAKSIAGVVILAVGVWWLGMAPPEYLQAGDPIVFDDAVLASAQKVDASNEFSEQLEVLASDLPGHDDVIFLEHGSKALASGMDGKLWLYDFNKKTAEVFVDPPLMASGLHESPITEEELYFCASHLWGDSYPAEERVGLYKIHLPTREISPIVLDVPAAELSEAKVWPLGDPKAPQMIQGEVSDSRPLAFCNDLEISNDGKRIYFSEPFSYAGASMGGGTVHEVMAYRGNGRIWHHDLDTGETRLVVEGFHFLDGLLVDLHPGVEREQSIVSSLTPGFRMMRFYVSGEKAGQSELVQDGLPGMCDGLDRDLDGNVWCGMIADRSAFLTWLHANPWMKEILLRLPLNSMSPPKKTGIMAFSSDFSQVLYYAAYEGPKVSQIASAIPGPDGYIYLTPFSRTHRGLVRLPNPLE